MARYHLILAGALALAACQSSVQVRGNLPDPEVLAEVRSGVHGRDDVAGLLGSPSAASTFKDNTWYYIGQRVEQGVSFLRPDVVEQKIVEVTFDDTGIVESMKTYDLADARDVDPVGRETPTEGRDLTLLQQLFGNIGRFPTDVLTDR